MLNMQQITGTHLVTSSSDAGATSYTTASISPTKNRLVIVSVMSFLSGGTPAIPTVYGASMSFEPVQTLQNAATTFRQTLFVGLSPNPGIGAVTIDFAGVSQTRCYWSIAEFANVDTSGRNGRNAVVQSSATNNASSTSSSTTLGAFSHPNNATYGSGRASGLGTGYSQGSGFTNLGTNQGTSFICSFWRNDNDTTVDWSQTAGNTDMMTLALELKVATPDARDYRHTKTRRNRFSGVIGATQDKQ